MRSTGKREPVLSKLQAYLRNVPIGPGDSLLVAVSGGTDSTALAYALKELSLSLPFSFALGYFNHLLRSAEECAEEAAFVKLLSERLQVPLHYAEARRGEIVTIAEVEKRSVEEVARAYRYRFLLSLAKTHGFSFVCTAHTASDNEETQVLRIFQGSSPSGLRGLPSRRGVLLRPFIHVRREEIVRFLQARGISHLEDTSNQDTRFLRNAVRRKLLPAIKEVFPGYHTALYRLGVKMGWIESFLQEELSQRDPWKQEGGEWRCPADGFFSLPPILRLYSLYRLFDKTKPKGGSRFPFKFLFPLVQDPPQRNFDGVWEKGGLRIHIKGGTIRWESNIVQIRKKGYLYVLEGSVKFSVGGDYQVEVSTMQGNEYQTSSSTGVVVVDKARFKNLILRNGRPGDSILTPSGRKSVKKLLQNLKIESHQRNQVPLIQGDGEILAVFPCLEGRGPLVSTLVQAGGTGGPVSSLSVSVRVSNIKSGEACE